MYSLYSILCESKELKIESKDDRKIKTASRPPCSRTQSYLLKLGACKFDLSFNLMKQRAIKECIELPLATSMLFSNYIFNLR